MWIMSSYGKKYTADFFKKDGVSLTGSNEKIPPDVTQTDDSDDKSKESETSSDDETCGDETLHENETSTGDETSTDDGTRSEDETSNGDETQSESETSCEDDTPTKTETCRADERSNKDETSNKDEPSCEGETRSGDETYSKDEIGEEFKSEDNLISRLYRRVVDGIMDSKHLTESTVDAAIDDIKQKLHRAYKRGYRYFPQTDFSRHENCCGYLRRYAICHTGLVKRVMWNFFIDKKNTSRTAKTDIMHKNWLKVVSLGGGPGNDLVGFCSALQEIPNYVEKLELTVVDIGEGWRNVFPEILKQAKATDCGSFSLISKKKIITHFIKADLTKGEVFSDANLSSVLEQADVLLMVKLLSHLPKNVEPGDLIHNTVDSMRLEAKLVFIDHFCNRGFFREIESLYCIYQDSLKYELCFKPKKLQSPSIAYTHSHVAIYEKKKILAEESSDSEKA